MGRRLWRIGAQAAEPRGLRELALPYMADLYAATRENVQLAVLAEDRALCLERLRGPQSVPLFSRVAGELPLHATGVGKVLLAFAGEETADRVLGGRCRAHPEHGDRSGATARRAGGDPAHRPGLHPGGDVGGHLLGRRAGARAR